MPNVSFMESWSQAGVAQQPPRRAARKHSRRIALTVAGSNGTRSKPPQALHLQPVGLGWLQQPLLAERPYFCSPFSVRRPQVSPHIQLCAAPVRGKRCWRSHEIPAQHTTCPPNSSSFNSLRQALAPSTHQALTPSQTASWGARKSPFSLSRLKRASDRRNPDTENHLCLLWLQTPELAETYPRSST